MIKALAFIYKKNELSDEEFQGYYENTHAPLASSLLTFEDYERNYIYNNLQDMSPLYSALGSISIFKYQSMKSLEIVEEQMSSSKGDTLREDELNFMNISKNYFVLTESPDLTEEVFDWKIFCPSTSSNIEELSILNSIDGLRKISDNLLLEPSVFSMETIAIPEYGILGEDLVNLDTLKAFLNVPGRWIFTSSMR